MLLALPNRLVVRRSMSSPSQAKDDVWRTPIYSGRLLSSPTAPRIYNVNLGQLRWNWQWNQRRQKYTRSPSQEPRGYGVRPHCVYCMGLTKAHGAGREITLGFTLQRGSLLQGPWRCGVRPRCVYCMGSIKAHKEGGGCCKGPGTTAYASIACIAWDRPGPPR
ncbi:hypothetical protein AG1IA_07857 [Rhizoctonia solani AG-1 IA]|uniref:Uncharacterized protein n=1 Tax=Thanatephorus cucumeris (strain AG1-IA) TaxID=983506 RepID=L8WMV5_THACA|nr:hypothetical protein AG1IA_07857 [Rhizoctonia solani AG-1 IA]